MIYEKICSVRYNINDRKYGETLLSEMHGLVNSLNHPFYTEYSAISCHSCCTKHYNGDKTFIKIS